MVSFLAAICGIINLVILLLIAPIYAYKKRLNFWKEPFSHLGDRKDTKTTFSICLISLFVLQLIFCLGIIYSFKLGFAGYFILGISVFSGFIPAVFPSQKFVIIHSGFAFISIIFAFIFSLFVDVNLFLHPVFQPLGLLSLITSLTMLIAVFYFLKHKHTPKHVANGVEELFIVASIILWNFSISAILISLR